MGRQIPDHVRFVTFTARYNRDYWITVAGLGQHYERAEVDAVRSNDRTRYIVTTHNVTRLVLDQTDRAAAVTIDGQNIAVKAAPELAFGRSDETWRSTTVQDTGLHKRHGLQGPIDDAFLEPFLVVRPTGKPWNPAANNQVMRILERFERQYSLAYRGHIRIKMTRM
jgi:hypothetical protein